jgi:hypothetical protein
VVFTAKNPFDTVHLISLITGISYFNRYLNVELKIRPDIRYPAFRLAGYPSKSVSGVFLFKTYCCEQCCGYGMFIPDPEWILDPTLKEGCKIKPTSFLFPAVSGASVKVVSQFHKDSRIKILKIMEEKISPKTFWARDPEKNSSQIKGGNKPPNPGSATLVISWPCEAFFLLL